MRCSKVVLSRLCLCRWIYIQTGCQTDIFSDILIASRRFTAGNYACTSVSSYITSTSPLVPSKKMCSPFHHGIVLSAARFVIVLGCLPCLLHSLAGSRAVPRTRRPAGRASESTQRNSGLANRGGRIARHAGSPRGTPDISPPVTFS